MGFASNYLRDESTVPATVKGTPSPDGRARWREIFGSTDKERGGGQEAYNGKGPGKTIYGSDAAMKRLIQAMRSVAPGGWSDDRWEQSRHFNGIQYLAIHQLCLQLQRAEFQVFREDDSHPDGKRPVTKNDPAEGDRQCKPYDLVKLLKRPNKKDSWGKIMYRWGQQKRMTGKALTWMVPNVLGTPMELYCIPTAIAIPQPQINPDFPDGYYRIQPVYPYGPFSSYPTPATAVGAPVDARWMMDFSYPHPLLRYDGYSPMTAMRQHLDAVEMIDRSRGYAMRRGINPSAVLTFDEVEGAQPLQDPEIERIKASFEAEQMGPENFGKLHVAAPGSKLEPWGGRPVDMEYQAGWEQLVSFILAGYGITKPAAGMIEDSSYSTLFATMKQLYWQTLEPECEDIGSELTHFLAPFFGDNLIVEVRCKPINDHEVKQTKLNFLKDCKALTKNEARHESDMPLTKEEWGGDIAGDPSPQEKEQQEAQQQQGAMGGAMPGAAAPAGEAPQATPNPYAPQGGAEAGQGAQQLQPADQEMEAANEQAETERERPSPGKLSQGALGPRKYLKNPTTNGRGLNGHTKSLSHVPLTAEKTLEVCCGTS